MAGVYTKGFAIAQHRAVDGLEALCREPIDQPRRHILIGKAPDADRMRGLAHAGEISDFVDPDAGVFFPLLGAAHHEGGESVDHPEVDAPEGNPVVISGLRNGLHIDEIGLHRLGIGDDDLRKFAQGIAEHIGVGVSRRAGCQNEE